MDSSEKSTETLSVDKNKPEPEEPDSESDSDISKLPSLNASDISEDDLKSDESEDESGAESEDTEDAEDEPQDVGEPKDHDEPENESGDVSDVVSEDESGADSEDNSDADSDADSGDESGAESEDKSEDAEDSEPEDELKSEPKQVSFEKPLVSEKEDNPEINSEDGPVPESEKLSESSETFEQKFADNQCDNILNKYSKTCNNILRDKELLDSEELKTNTDNDYPSHDDPNFNIKIASKTEFGMYKYDAELEDVQSRDIKTYADYISSIPFELSPHQHFVKNFLSPSTPYNSLLLFHGLGTGKTCSAIGIAEEERDFIKNIGLKKKIIIIATPNVQENFKLQLFSDKDLKQENGLWRSSSCLGNKFIEEVNPTNIKNIPKEKMVALIKGTIAQYYSFMGYGQFASFIESTAAKGSADTPIKMIQNIQKEFNGRLLIFDEIHNVTDVSDKDSENKRISQNLMRLVKAASVKLLLLTATPMFNSYKSIIWLINLMNINDKRSHIQVNEVFNKEGEFIEGDDLGKNLLIRKSRGYISFVRGDNPYIFPFRVHPSIFAPEKTFKIMDIPNDLTPYEYPKYQLNERPIEDKINILSIYLNDIDEYQNKGYQVIIDGLKNRPLKKINKYDKEVNVGDLRNMKTFTYLILQLPLEALNIVYPHPEIDVITETSLQSLSDSENSEMTKLESLESIQSEFTNSDLETPKSINSARGRLNDIVSKLPINTIKEKKQKAFNSFREIMNSLVESQKKKDNMVRLSEQVTGGSTETLEPPEIDVEDVEDVEENTEKRIREKYIDVHSFTGSEGLRRVMDFEENENAKGSFTYKPEIIKQYGAIFSPENIGKYSCKIKEICRCIRGETMSEGIILIYSQYIDAGIIPMALALEEIGFSRYSAKGSRNLFKNKPKTKLKYIMITGDKRISPNNVLEYNAARNDNTEGDKVKVILISSAGSEGLDFKCIRQIHVMEPWYNINKLEQVLGRGIRNFSHKLLPFEKRNVQIFLHGTILKNVEEESVDLYIYRLAEKKAIAIGKVSKVLKENAVDCIINHSQFNFNHKNFNNILQILSNGAQIPDFPVGDTPYSSNCDYQESCEYECVKTDVVIEEEVVTEQYLDKTSDNVIHGILEMFKKNFFYKKKDFKMNYDIKHIDYALTKLIDEKKIIYDKYNRPGNVINIGEYYLFQPMELEDKLSVFERSVPVDVKINSVIFNIKADARKANRDEQYENELEELEALLDANKYDLDPSISFNERELGMVEEEPQDVAVYNPEKVEVVERVKHSEVLNEMLENYMTAKEVAENDLSNFKNESHNWYKNCGVAMQYLHTKIDQDDLYEYLIEHIVDSMFYKDKYLLLQYLFITNNSSFFEDKLREIFDRKILKLGGKIFIVLYDKERVILRLNNQKWEGVTFEEEKLVVESLRPDGSVKSKYIGFIEYDSKHNRHVFKTRNTIKETYKGAKCEEMGKNKTIEMLNEINGEEFTKDNTKAIKKTSLHPGRPVLVSSILCIILEFYMRHYDKIQREGKKWFYGHEEYFSAFK